MSIQFDTAFDFFVSIYGFPTWEDKPKQGQSKEKIIQMWENELRPYSASQIKAACMRLVKYKKTMTFPTIALLMTELYNERKEAQIEEEERKRKEAYERRIAEENQKKKAEEERRRREEEEEKNSYFYWFYRQGVFINNEQIGRGLYAIACWRLINDMCQTAPERYQNLTWREKCRVAEKNGWVLKIMSYCEKEAQIK